MGIWDEVAKKTGIAIKTTNGATINPNGTTTPAMPKVAQTQAPKTTAGVPAAVIPKVAPPAPAIPPAIPRSGVAASTAVPKPAATPAAIPKTTTNANLAPGYAAAQQQRYQQALASGDKDLIGRLEDDAKRVGYSLNGSNDKYFDSNFGGKDKYANDQQTRYAQARASGDLDLMKRIEADAARVGYSLNTEPMSLGIPPAPLMPQAAQINAGGSQGYIPTYTGPNMTGMTEQLKAIFSNRQASELQKMRDAQAIAQQGYNKLETQSKQQGYDSRNQADVVNAQTQQRLNETMANAGLTGDGQNLTINAQLGASRLGALTNINNQQNAQLQDIGERRALLDNNAAKNELALMQQINSDQAAAQYDLMKYGDTRAFDVERYNYDRYSDDLDRDFRQDQFEYQQGQDRIRNDAQYGGTYNGQKTADQSAREWQQRFDYGNAIGKFGNGQQTLEMQRFEEDRKRYGEEWAYKKARDQISDEQYKMEFDENVRQFGLNYALDKAMQSAQISNMKADNERMAANQSSGGSSGGSSAKYVYKQDPDFIQDYTDAVSDPVGFGNWLRNNAQAAINKYGIDGYNALKALIPKE